jgi:CheY-like chemotaxis protein
MHALEETESAPVRHRADCILAQPKCEPDETPATLTNIRQTAAVSLLKSYYTTRLIWRYTCSSVLPMLTVLILEDDFCQREIIRIALDKTFLVLEADTPAKALELCELYPAEIDILICDFSLPGMNAAQLIPRATKLRPELKVLVISGYSEQHVRDAGIPEDYSILAKPFQLAQIRQKLQSL